MSEEKELSEKEQQFLSAWWNSETIEQVVEKLDDQYQGKSEKTILTSLRNRARAYREAGVAMPYLRKKSRTTTPKAEIDTVAALSFIKTLGKTQKDINAARKAQEDAKASTAAKLKGTRAQTPK